MDEQSGGERPRLLEGANAMWLAVGLGFLALIVIGVSFLLEGLFGEH